MSQPLVPSTSEEYLAEYSKLKRRGLDMQIKLTTLSENTVGSTARGLLAEWGLSILIEVEEQVILMDTGGGMVAANNAVALGIDLAKVSQIVLSHGHYDHTGGLRDILVKTGEVEVVAHPDIWAPKYARPEEEPERYIGIPFVKEELESLGASFMLSRKPVRLSDQILTSGEIPMKVEFESIDPQLYVREGDVWQPDELPDDRALIIKTEEGLVVVLGCAHRGVINTLKHAQELTGEERIYAVVGGMHLMVATEERVLLTIAALQEMGVKRVAASHCTGLPAACLLAQQLGESFTFNSVGTQLTLP